MSTLAGNGKAGWIDGPGNTAEFGTNDEAMRTSVDNTGNLYVADPGNYRLRKVTPNGTVSTIAGDGRPGYRDTLASYTEFSNITGAAIAPDGNIFIADFGNNVIRELTLSTDTAKPYSNIDTSVCEGQSVFGYTTSGTYVDTLTSFKGCDSIRTLHLIANLKSYSNIDSTICEGQSVFGYTETGIYTDILTAVNGCDSTRTLHLTVHKKSYLNIDTTICEGQSVFGYTTSGTYINNFTAANGCDSVRTLHLTVNKKSYLNIDTAVCEGQSVFGYSTSGTYIDVFKASNGCDSTRTLHLTVNKPVFTTINTTVCVGTIVYGHQDSGTYVDIFPLSTGCDSTRTLNLKIIQPIYHTIDSTVCQGTSVFGYSLSGSYTDKFTSVVTGCDSSRILHLTVKPTQRYVFDTSICYGYSFQGYTTSGTYVKTFTGSNGCDSTYTLNLTVFDKLLPDLGGDAILCTEESKTLTPGNFDRYRWQDSSTGSSFTATKAGAYFVTVYNQCDSATATIKLVEQSCNVTFPSAFTPNNDGLNDFFKVLHGGSINSYHLIIFNRLGQKNFETTSVTQGWNGMLSAYEEPQGVYVYQCWFNQRQ